MIATISLLRVVLVLPIAGILAACAPGGRATTTPGPVAFNVRALGAVGDGVTVDTRPLQSAIDSVSARQGGVVDVPPGRYLTGTLFLRSGVTLRLAEGAVLIGSTDVADYYNLTAVAPDRLPRSNYHQDEARFSALILALDQHDVAIVGRGTIDGRGATVAANIHRLQADGKLAGNPRHRPDEALRPTLLNLVRCRNVTVADVTLRDSACWCQVYCDCEHVDVRDVTVRSRAFWNNDGIDVCGGRDVRVTGLDAEVTDDGICLKSNATRLANVTVSHCRVSSWANGIKLGTASCVGFEHVRIDHVAITTAGHSGVAIESVDGGDLHDVVVSDVTMTGVTHGILVKLGDRQRNLGHVSTLSGVTLRDVTGALRSEPLDVPASAAVPFPPDPRGFAHNRFPAVVISGLPGHPVTDVRLEHVRFTTPGGGSVDVANAPIDELSRVVEHPKAYPEYSMHGELPAVGLFCRHAAGLTVNDLTVDVLEEDYRPPFVFDDVDGLALDRVSATGVPGPTLTVFRGVREPRVDRTDGVVVLPDDDHPGQPNAAHP